MWEKNQGRWQWAIGFGFPPFVGWMVGEIDVGSWEKEAGVGPIEGQGVLVEDRRSIGFRVEGSGGLWKAVAKG